MKQWRAVLIVVSVWMAGNPALAQTGEATQLADAQVRHALNLALRNIHKALCGDAACAVATADEFVKPPITLDQARTAINTGVLSGTAQWCGLDWKHRLFLPMMSRFTAEAQPSERQRALFALLHGIYQGQVSASLAPRGPCPDDVKAGIEKRMAG
jgi:hypothetical protein